MNTKHHTIPVAWIGDLLTRHEPRFGPVAEAARGALEAIDAGDRMLLRYHLTVIQAGVEEPRWVEAASRAIGVLDAGEPAEPVEGEEDDLERIRRGPVRSTMLPPPSLDAATGARS